MAQQTPTVGDARAWAMRQLAVVPDEIANLAAELLLGHVLGWPRVRVLAHPEATLTGSQFERFSRLVRRRVKGEPLQYLTGEQEFYGLHFAVTPGVLIPRPETEILVEQALAIAAHKTGPIRIVDVGIGSGCIAVSVLMERADALVWGTDLSEAALAVAQKNAVRHGVQGRLQLVRGDLLDCVTAAPVFDFVLSNPPYVALGDRELLPPSVRREPDNALFGGESGLEVLARLIPQAARRLAGGGFLLLEIGAGQDLAVSGLIKAAGLLVMRVEADLQGIPRCVIAQRSS